MPHIHLPLQSGDDGVLHRMGRRYLSADENCVLEREPLANLARDRELSVYQHPAFWACMDTQRDYEYLTRLWESGNPPWGRHA